MILALLTPAERRAFARVGAVGAVVGLVEAASVLSATPFIALAASPDLIDRSGALAAVRSTGLITTANGFLIALGLASVLALLAAIAARFAALEMTTRFVSRVAVDLGARFFAGRLGQDYETHLARRSADVAAAAIAETDSIVNGAMLEALRLVAHVAIALGLFAVLAAFDPVAALTMATLVCAGYGAAFAAARRRIGALGAARSAGRRRAQRAVQEAIEGVRQVKAFGLEGLYAQRYREGAETLARAGARIEMLREAPRGALEALTFGGMTLIVVWMLWSRDGDVRAALPTLAVFAIAGARLLPTLQRLYRSASGLRAGVADLERMAAALAEIAPPGCASPGCASSGCASSGCASSGCASDLPAPRPRREIALEGVSFRHSGAAAPSLLSADLRLPVGASCALTGPSGAGKSTLADVLCGLIAPRQGRLLVDGAPLARAQLRRWRAQVGYVPQTAWLAEGSIAENIAWGEPPGRIDAARVAQAAQAAQILDVIAALGGFDAPAGERGGRLSGGQRQRVALARALYRDPALLILDEATSALDAETEARVLDAALATQGRRTVLVITHNPAVAARCDRIARMEAGRVVG